MILCLCFSASNVEGEVGRSRRSIASVNGDVNHYEDPEKFHHQPPNITPVGGVPNLKVKALSRFVSELCLNRAAVSLERVFV